jgi:hypothetical protein
MSHVGEEVGRQKMQRLPVRKETGAFIEAERGLESDGEGRESKQRQGV